MGNTSSRRIVFDIGLFLVTLLLPWWASLAMALWGVVSFASFYEILLVGIYYDVVYHPAPVSFPAGYWGVSISLGLFVLAGMLRERITLYGHSN